MSDAGVIRLRGVKVNNLKNIDVDIPHNKLVVITGLSGSGKTSLAFDTLFAEGQRRYVESLSSYARQFLGRMNKPEVDFIAGIPPAIAVRQKVKTHNPRSTVGTSSEIYEYIKLLYARIGRTFSPVSGAEVRRHSVDDVVNFITSQEVGTKVIICFPYLLAAANDVAEQLQLLFRQGYSRVICNGEVRPLDGLAGNVAAGDVLQVVLDRVVVKTADDLVSRLSDSVQTAFFEGHDNCQVAIISNDGQLVLHSFSNRFEADGIVFEEPSEALFSFNSPVGACPQCGGFGNIVDVDPDLVIPDKTLSLYDNAVACWRGQVMQEWKNAFIDKSAKYNFPIHRPYNRLSDDEKMLLWNGNDDLPGIKPFFDFLETQKYKIQYRVMIARYRGKTVCPKCHGKRLRPEAMYVKVNGRSIGDLVDVQISKLLDFFSHLTLTDYEQAVSRRLLHEIIVRLQAVVDVGLGYLTLNRPSSTLSGGESQRINLAALFGSGLIGSLYILDEPSIGLHQRDTQNLIKILKRLRDIGNTVVVVEHDEDIIRSADYIIDIGPEAGINGGKVVFCGSVDDLLRNSNSLTAKYLRGDMKNPTAVHPHPWCNSIEVVGAKQNNLKNINVKFPLGVLTVVTGVSGSGKTTLVKDILYPAVKRCLCKYCEWCGSLEAARGDFAMIDDIEYISQEPIGKSSRSNPAIYIRAFDEIRKLFAEQPYARANLYKAGHFSFNVPGGRCENCLGEGEITVEMQFMADVRLVCEECNGKRFKDDILRVRYREKNIYDVLEMSISEAFDFFAAGHTAYERRICFLLQQLIDVGLGYVKMGQPSSTLSGGENQRIKLAGYLAAEYSKPTIFIFDEPTTGLHFHDINKLLAAFDRMRSRGHTLVVIEHNREVIRFADYIIELGPEGGDNGGRVIYTGPPRVTP